MNNAKLKIYTREKGRILSSNSKLIPKADRPSSAIPSKDRATPSPNKFHYKKPTLGTSSNNINIDPSLPNIGTLTPIKTHSHLHGIRNNPLMDRSVTPTKKRYEIKKDSMVEENLMLKTQNQKLQTEVAQRRAEFYRLENELRQKDKLIDELVRVDKQNLLNGIQGGFTQTPEKKFKNKELALILSLKRQIKEMQKDLKLKDDLIEGLRKQIKLTKLNEYETEIKTLNEEIVKLKTLYENEINLKDIKEKEPSELQFLKDSQSSQQQLINSLQEHNNKLLQEKKELEEKNLRLKQKYKSTKESQSDISVCKVDSSVELKAQTFELEGRISELLREVDYYKEHSSKREKWIKELEENYDKNTKDTKEYYESIRKKDREIIDELVQENKTLTDKVYLKDKEILQISQKLKEVESKYQAQIDDILSRSREELEKNSHLNQKEKVNVFIEIMSTNDMENTRYILNQSLSARKVDFYTVKSLVDEVREFDVNFDDYFNSVASSILMLLGNKNTGNSKELVAYFKNLSVNSSHLSIDLFKENFYNSLDIKIYNEDEELNLSNIFNSTIARYKASMAKKMKRFDYLNSGYVTFHELEYVMRKYNIDKQLFDFIVMKMKTYNDEFSNLFNMKYEIMLNLLDDIEPDVGPARKASTASGVIISKSEEAARSEDVLKRIAEFIYRNDSTIRNIFSDTILIGEKNVTYNAMYLAVFLNILKEEMNLTLDATDSICIFNRLRNSSNLHNVELVDVDLLAQELIQFGIKEYEDDGEAQLNNIDQGSNWEDKFHEEEGQEVIPETNQIDELLTSKEQNEIRILSNDIIIKKENEDVEPIGEEEQEKNSKFIVEVDQEHKQEGNAPSVRDEQSEPNDAANTTENVKENQDDPEEDSSQIQSERSKHDSSATGDKYKELTNRTIPAGETINAPIQTLFIRPTSTGFGRRNQKLFIKNPEGL